MKRINWARANQNRGGVSIFIVVFTALMVTIVTASFVQIVLRNQQIASSNDLSQSAYDSAMAGVEDAKRVLVRLRQCENNPSDDCEVAIRQALQTDRCDSLQSASGGAIVFNSTTHEVQVGGSGQNQAYTCVKVDLDTKDVSGTLVPGEPVVIPLKGNASFDRVKLSWFTVEDLPEGATVSIPWTATPTLPPEDEWPDTTPPVMRAQLIQFNKGDIQLSQFAGGNSRALFLYPTSSGSSSYSFATDARMDTVTARNDAKLVRCSPSDLTDETKGYACSVTLALPNPTGGSKATREAYLQLQTTYGMASFQVELFDNTTDIKFNGVQPAVDSTGRASDFFRRVRAKLRVTDGAINPFLPNAALTTEGNLCKDFFVTDKVSEYEPGECSPDSDSEL